MSLTDFIIHIFCLCDDFLNEMTRAEGKLRQRGPTPALADSEVLAMEVVGEFLGFDEERRIFTHFCRHHGALFPKLKGLRRVTFTRQAANLWRVKERLWRHLLKCIHHDERISIVDSFPVPVCRFARANRCKRFAGAAAFGYDEMAKQTFYGFRAHLRVAWPGVVVSFDLTPANVHDLKMAEELTEKTCGWLLGDRNYWSPDFCDEASERGLRVLAPFKSKRMAILSCTEEVPPFATIVI